MINRRRVVETYDPGADRRGTGFLVSSSLVLTAAHCVPSGRGAVVAVRNEQEADFRDDVTVRWVGSGNCDIAVLELANPRGYGRVAARPVSFGRPVDVVEWQAVGFPWAQERQGRAGPRTAAESAAGRLDPLTGMRAGTYDVEITSGMPQDRGQGLSPWGGMSGAAVFAEGALIAVLVEDPDRFGPDRLRAVPITWLLEDPEAVALVAPGGTPEVEPVWSGHREMLARPYEPLPSPPSPLLLLQYQYAALPFHAARADDLAALQAWCEDDATVAAAIVEGVGGTGKTRLAAELCRIFRSQGWVAGLLVGSVSPERLGTFARLAEPRLVVIDAAETRASDVLALATVLASQPQQATVRMLLLARSMGPGGMEVAGWWRSLQTARNPLQAAFLAAERRSLTPLLTGDAGVGARRGIFQAARQRFAQLLQVPDSATEPEDFSEPTYDTFLFLQIAALVALTAPDQLSASEAELLTAVLDTERELIWRRSARAQGLSIAGSDATDVELDVALAVATLAIADGRDSAVALLEKVPDVVAAGPVTRVADWLRGLYPGDGWLRPIRPDRLGEHHAGRVVGDHPGLPKLLLDYAAARLDAEGVESTTEPPRLAGRTLTVLARAAARDDDQGRKVRQCLEVTLNQPGVGGESLLGRFVDLAIRYQTNVITIAPLASGLTATLGVTQIPAVAAAVSQLKSQFDKTYVLEDLEDAVNLQHLQHARELAADDPARRPELFEALLGAYVALMHSGRRTDSVAMLREALGLARQLHTEDPDRYGAKLAQVLELISGSGIDAGEGLGYAREALALREQLSANDPHQLSILASNYQTLAFRLSDMGRYQEAVQAAEQQIAVLEAQVEANPSRADYMYDQISSARGWSARHLAKAGRTEEAIQYARAYVLKEQLAQPGNDVLLAIALGLLADVLRDVGRAAEAIEPAARQVEIYRGLESRSPGRSLDQLVLGLMTLANTLRDARRNQEAVDVDREIVALHRRMAETSPSRHRPALGMMLGNLSISLIAAGRSDEAVDSMEEAVSIWEQLAAQGTGDSQQLAGAYGNYNHALTAAGRHDEALDAARKAVAIWEALTAQDTGSRQQLAHAYQTLANSFHALGRSAEALEFARRGVRLLQALEEERPGQFTAHLAGALNTLASSLRDAGHNQDGVEVARQVVVLYRRLAEASPTHLPDLTMMLGNLSYALVDVGRSDEAVRAAEEALGIWEQLAAQSPEDYQRLGFTLASFINALAASDRREEALHVASQAVTIWEDLEAQGRGDTSQLQQARQTLQDLLNDRQR